MPKSIDRLFHQPDPDIWHMIKGYFKCNRSHIAEILPILKWLPVYKRQYLLYDFIAGLTVALTAIPQGIAFAALADLPPHFGLYSELMPGFVYMLFGNTTYLRFGPTVIMALMVKPIVRLSTDFTVLCTFLMGIIITLTGILNLGFIMDFISLPVTVGFVTAAAITICSTQIKSLLAIPGSSSDFIGSWSNIFKYLDHVKLWDSMLGLLSIIILIGLKVKGAAALGPRWKALSLSRNAIVVLLGSLLAYLLHRFAYVEPFALTGEVARGLPSFGWPPFSTQVNGTHYDFPDMAYELSTTLASMTLISIVELFAVAKAFSMDQPPIDASQELIALGLCNLMGSFVCAIPVAASFSRTSLNVSSGVITVLSGIIVPILMMVSVTVMVDAFPYIPKTVLAAVIILAVFPMIMYEKIALFWRTDKKDMVPLSITLITCLGLGSDYGILVGVAVNIGCILKQSTTLGLVTESVKVSGNRILLVVPDQSVFFSSSEYLRNTIIKFAFDHEAVNWIVINGEFVQRIDATVAVGLDRLVNEMAAINKRVVFLKWKREPLGVLYRTNKMLVKRFSHAESLDILLTESDLHVSDIEMD